jgi:hypothetical protein
MDLNSCEMARHELLDALAGVVLPDSVLTGYGETIDPDRYLRFMLKNYDQPTLCALAAIVRAAKRAGQIPSEQPTTSPMNATSS